MKKRIISLFGMGICAALLTVALVACGGSGAQDNASGSAAAPDDAEAGYTLVTEGTLTVASDLAYPSLESINPDTQEPEGFAVDRMGAIADKLGLELVYLPAMKFDTIIPLIRQGGTADVGVASFTITDERWEEIDFTDPYMDSNQSVAVKDDGTYTEVDQLNAEGVQIAVQSGTTGEAWARENLPNATVVPLDEPVQCLNGLATGMYQGYVGDLPPTSYTINLSYPDLTILAEIPTGEQYGIVVSKDNPELTAALNQALAELQADGTIAELQQKWFGAEI